MVQSHAKTVQVESSDRTCVFSTTNNNDDDIGGERTSNAERKYQKRNKHEYDKDECENIDDVGEYFDDIVFQVSLRRKKWQAQDANDFSSIV